GTPGWIDGRLVLLAGEIDAGQRPVAGDEQHFAQRRFGPAITDRVLHDAPFHRCMTAYARHGRHASLLASARAGFVSCIAFGTMRSLAGKPSGHPSARIAPYGAAHEPMPGTSVRCAIAVSTSAPGARSMSPSATAVASATTVRARADVSPTPRSSG